MTSRKVSKHLLRIHVQVNYQLRILLSVMLRSSLRYMLMHLAILLGILRTSCDVYINSSLANTTARSMKTMATIIYMLLNILVHRSCSNVIYIEILFLWLFTSFSRFVTTPTRGNSKTFKVVWSVLFKRTG